MVNISLHKSNLYKPDSYETIILGYACVKRVYARSGKVSTTTVWSWLGLVLN